MKPRADTVTLSGGDVEVEWHGPDPASATTLVFLHEGLGSVSIWRDFPARLAEATGTAALVYSRFGYGASTPCRLPRPLTYMHDEGLIHLPELIAATGIKDHVVIGHSDGGSIALIYAGAAARPRLRGIALMAAHVFNEAINVKSIAAARVAFDAGDLRQRLVRHHGANTDCAFNGWCDAWLDPDFMHWNIEEYLPSVTAPLLIMQGNDDEYGSMAQVRAIEAKSAGPSDVVLLPNCGHSPHRDATDATLATMTAFITDLKSGRVL
jgi:pimeloyl-ACP methyl ester carboxylesterase